MNRCDTRQSPLPKQPPQEQHEQPFPVNPPGPGDCELSPRTSFGSCNPDSSTDRTDLIMHRAPLALEPQPRVRTDACGNREMDPSTTPGFGLGSPPDNQKMKTTS